MLVDVCGPRRRRQRPGHVRREEEQALPALSGAVGTCTYTHEHAMPAKSYRVWMKQRHIPTWGTGSKGLSSPLHTFLPAWTLSCPNPQPLPYRRPCPRPRLHSHPYRRPHTCACARALTPAPAGTSCSM